MIEKEETLPQLPTAALGVTARGVEELSDKGRKSRNKIRGNLLVEFCAGACIEEGMGCALGAGAVFLASPARSRPQRSVRPCNTELHLTKKDPGLEIRQVPLWVWEVVDKSIGV